MLARILPIGDELPPGRSVDADERACIGRDADRLGEIIAARDGHGALRLAVRACGDLRSDSTPGGHRELTASAIRAGRALLFQITNFREGEMSRDRFQGILAVAAVLTVAVATFPVQESFAQSGKPEKAGAGPVLGPAPAPAPSLDPSSAPPVRDPTPSSTILQ